MRGRPVLGAAVQWVGLGAQTDVVESGIRLRSSRFSRRR